MEEARGRGCVSSRLFASGRSARAPACRRTAASRAAFPLVCLARGSRFATVRVRSAVIEDLGGAMPLFAANDALPCSWAEMIVGSTRAGFAGRASIYGRLAASVCASVLRLAVPRPSSTEKKPGATALPLS